MCIKKLTYNQRSDETNLLNAEESCKLIVKHRVIKISTITLKTKLTNNLNSAVSFLLHFTIIYVLEIIF